MKIGITTRGTHKAWSNGMHQNVYLLIKILRKIGYNAYPISQLEEDNDIFGIPIIKISEKNINSFDFIFEASTNLTENLFLKLKDSRKRLLTIQYGNFYISNHENFLPSHKRMPSLVRVGHTILTSPHYIENSKPILDILSRRDTKTIPYIWSPEMLKISLKKDDFNFDIESCLSRIGDVGVFEPNISITKTLLAPLAILNLVNKESPNCINSATIFSTYEQKKENRLSLINEVPIYLSGKISLKDRYPLPFILKNKYNGSILSNHFENDLNYVTLESLYLNIPITHNSKFCMDAGYYYSDFDIVSAKNNVIKMIKEHDPASYKSSAENVLWKFSPENPEVILKYKDLMDWIVKNN